MSDPINHATLLRKYIRHVLDEEGVTFLESLPKSDSSAGFTPEEWITLTEIASEVLES